MILGWMTATGGREAEGGYLIAEASGADWGAGVTVTSSSSLLSCALKTGLRIAPAEAGSGEVTGTQKL